jgi:tetratricopeptide (TPR) repeat protein
VDRALEAFTEVLRLDPENQYALTNLEKLYEEQHQWEEAYATRHKLARGDTDTSQARHQEILLGNSWDLRVEADGHPRRRAASKRDRSRQRTCGLPQSG